MLGGLLFFEYLCNCERTGEENRERLDGVKHVLRRVNARVCAAESHAPADLWLHRQRHKEMRDEDPTYEIWRWVIPGERKMDLTGHDSLCSVSLHDEKGQLWSLSFGFVDIREKLGRRLGTVLQENLLQPS